MQYKVVISNTKGKFPIKGLNELLNGRMYNFRTKKYHNSVKQENDRVCMQAIKKCMPGIKIEKPIKCVFYIYAQDKRHDRGNLSSATEKSFLDALQMSGRLKNDSWNWVYDSEFHTDVDAKKPRVEVIIEEVEDQ